jgi:hypothetical protein
MKSAETACQGHTVASIWFEKYMEEKEQKL